MTEHTPLELKILAKGKEIMEREQLNSQEESGVIMAVCGLLACVIIILAIIMA